LQTLLKDLPVADGTVSGDPSVLIQNILDDYNTQKGMTFEYNLDTYGTSISLGFEKDSMWTALQKIIKNQ
jgi:hypothetical protein